MSEEPLAAAAAPVSVVASVDLLPLEFFRTETVGFYSVQCYLAVPEFYLNSLSLLILTWGRFTVFLSLWSIV